MTKKERQLEGLLYFILGWTPDCCDCGIIETPKVRMPQHTLEDGTAHFRYCSLVRVEKLHAALKLLRSPTQEAA